jgi:1,6-anhydro-N-acetylmuramate kinase
MEARTRLVFGAMTGTSLDGVDVAAIEWTGGERPSVRLVGHGSGPLGVCSDHLGSLARGEALTGEQICIAAAGLSAAHVERFEDLRSRVGDPDLVAVHGQPVFHRPPLSWQLVEPWAIARAMDAPVVSDLRGADLACSGEGAPITPLSDLVWFGDEHEARVVLNLGGFANATVLPAGGRAEAVRGYDLCACNQVLNAVARRGLGAEFDEGGAAALRGKVIGTAAGELVSALRGQSSAGRSLGSGDEAGAWVERHGGMDGADLAATAVEAIAQVIAERVNAEDAARVVCAGGGVRNAALMGALRRMCGAAVGVSDEMGMPIETREAAAIATLGAMAADGRAITLEGVTGRGACGLVDGRWCFPKRSVCDGGLW